MMLMIIKNMLKQRTEAKASFFRNAILTRQRSMVGIDMTISDQLIRCLSVDENLRMTSVRISKTVLILSTAFSLCRACGVTQASARIARRISYERFIFTTG